MTKSFKQQNTYCLDLGREGNWRYIFDIVAEVLKTVSESITLHMLFHWASLLDNLTSNLFNFTSLIPHMSLPYWSSTSWPLFSLVAIAHKYVLMYACTLQNTDYLVHMILLACLFSGLVVWLWEENWCVITWGKPLLPLPVLLIFLLSCSFFF